MSRRKPDDSQNASLDLLLDTICNTFGGVLFISMLVVILLNMSAVEVAETPPSAQDAAELIELQTKLQQTAAEVSRLKGALEAQAEVEKQIVDPNLKGMMQQWRTAQQRRAALTENKNSDLKKIGQAQIEVNKLAEKIHNDSEALRKAKAELASAEKQLQQELQTRTRKAKLPKMRKTTKLEVAYMIQGGKLYACAIPSAGGLALNSAECTQKSDSTGPYLAPIPSAGLKVDLSGSNKGSISRKFSQLDAKKHYIAIAVWEDSFKEFTAVKDEMVRMNFEYRLMPLAAGEKVYMGASSTGDPLVQ